MVKESKQMKHSNEYIYGEGVAVLPIPQEVIDDRLAKIEIQIYELQSLHYSERNMERKKILLEARDFWSLIDNML